MPQTPHDGREDLGDDQAPERYQRDVPEERRTGWYAGYSHDCPFWSDNLCYVK